MKFKVFLAVVASIGLLAGAIFEEGRAQSPELLREYPKIFEISQKGKESCEKGELSVCVDMTRQVSQKIEGLRTSAGSFGERLLLIATRALTAAGHNVARGVVAVNKGDKDQACILLGNALLHVANAAEALDFLPLPNWEEEIKRSVRRLQADSTAQRRKLRPLVNKVCPSGEAL